MCQTGLSRHLKLLTSGHSDAQGWASECLDVKNYNWRFNPVWHSMLYSSTHMATANIEGLSTFLTSKYIIFGNFNAFWCHLMPVKLNTTPLRSTVKWQRKLVLITEEFTSSVCSEVNVYEWMTVYSVFSIWRSQFNVIPQHSHIICVTAGWCRTLYANNNTFNIQQRTHYSLSGLQVMPSKQTVL